MKRRHQPDLPAMAGATTVANGSRFAALGWMLIVALAYFLVVRAGLLGLSYTNVPHDPTTLASIFAIGLVYDLAFYSYALIPIALYIALVPPRWWRSRLNRGAARGAILLTLYALGFIAVAEFLFWDEFQARFNFISVDYLVYRREVTNNIRESYPLFTILAALLLPTMGSYLLLTRRLGRSFQCNERLSRRLGILGGLLSLPLLAFYLVDQSNRDFSANAYANELASNGPYQFIAAFRNNELDYFQFYATLPTATASPMIKHDVGEPTASRQARSSYDIRRWIDNPGTEARKNVILIMVESLSAEYLGTFGNTRGLTPFLDELAGQSLFFSHFYATGTRTVRGLESVTLSIPPTPGQSIVKRIGRETGFWSLGNVLREKGYDTQFIYGGNGYFDNMNAFFAGNGYGVIDEPAMPRAMIGFSNAWGIADENLYDVTLAQADRAHAANQPFFFHLMTTSNHRPYTYPEGRIDIPSGSGRDGAVKYTDWALRHLFEQARGKPWFKNTLFVIVADHCAGSAGKVALPLERYRIPLLVYDGGATARIVDTVASQIDVAPTVLALLHMDYGSAFFGKDILAMPATDGRALISNYQSLGLYQHGLLSVLSPNRKIEEQHHPESDDPDVASLSAPDDLTRDNIAYYQGASYIYSHRLNAWPPAKALVAR
ncbi:MAG: LTA synthase family protein [Porticoccaceae bacterium]